MTLIAPSLLAADWSKLADEILSIEQGGADWIHLDVMDGHFVPPITFGPQLVAAVKKCSNLTLDVHLMIEKPERQIEAFQKAGAHLITVHQETCPHLHRTIQQIKESGAKAGVALNPATPIEHLQDIIHELDLVLIMSVNPGWGGQKFLESSLLRISRVKSLINQCGRQIHLQVDGGINQQTASSVIKAGADVLVAGTYVFGSENRSTQIQSLKTP